MKIQKSVIIVNYKSSFNLKNCLQSIEKKEGQKKDLEVVIINNDSQPLRFEKQFSFSINLIEAGKNIGFGAACNRGAQQAQGEFLFFLNPDTFVKDNTIQKLASFLRKNPQIGVIAPKLVLAENNRPQAWTSGKKTTLFSILFKNTFGKPWKKNFPVSVDWVSGAALMTKKDLFEKVGGFDERFFMYFEDQDFCLRVKKLGFEVFFLPTAVVFHLDGKSWKNFQLKKQAYYQSQLLFFEKNCPSWQFFLLKVLHQFKKLFSHNG